MHLKGKVGFDNQRETGKELKRGQGSWDPQEQTGTHNLTPTLGPGIFIPEMRCLDSVIFVSSWSLQRFPNGCDDFALWSPKDRSKGWPRDQKREDPVPVPSDSKVPLSPSHQGKMALDPEQLRLPSTTHLHASLS